MVARGRWLADLRILGEAVAVIVVTWLVLAWFFVDRTITQGDGTVFWAPYIQGALRGGFAWTNHLYRFGVVGGSEMHDVYGTQPLVQLCALFGLTTTTTLNVITVFIQLCFAFFGIKGAEALVTTWSGAERKLSATERIIAVWACGFAPVFGWRLAGGHENLLLGLMPFIAAITLWWAARARTSSVVTLGFAAFAVFDGLSAPGQQLVIYSAVFGFPLLVATILDAPRGERWGRPQWTVVATLAGALLVSLPRVVGMVAHAAGPDAARGLGETVTYTFAATDWVDWLYSFAWTTRWHIVRWTQERNFPIGPLVLLAVALWPRTASRKLLWGLLAGGVLAVLFASDISPVSDVLLRVVPPLRAFRVPARAILPLLAFVPTLGLAAIWTWRPAAPHRTDWLWIGAGAVAFATGRMIPSTVREPLAWIACVAVVVLARWRPARLPAAALAVIAGLGVAAFDERFPRNHPYDRIEDGSQHLHDEVVAGAPELAMPLARVQIIDAPWPYDVGTAFAADLGSLDGDFNPPRRFITLFAALSGEPVDGETVVYKLTRDPAFQDLQQLYDVRYIVSIGDGSGSIQPLPDPPGAAWFPARIDTVDTAAEFATALHADRTRARTTGSLLRGDAVPAVPAACTGATVDRVTTDDLGQRATLEVTAAAPCALIVATTYVTALHATTAGGGELPVFPIDVALTGIAVPAGTSTITLAPEAWIPWWARVASLVGLALLGGALVSQGRRSE